MVSRILNLVLSAGASVFLPCSCFLGCVKLNPSSPKSREVGECVRIPPNIKISEPTECCKILERYHYLMGESALTEFHRATSKLESD